MCLLGVWKRAATDNAVPVPVPVSTVSTATSIKSAFTRNAASGPTQGSSG